MAHDRAKVLAGVLALTAGCYLVDGGLDRAGDTRAAIPAESVATHPLRAKFNAECLDHSQVKKDNPASVGKCVDDYAKQAIMNKSPAFIIANAEVMSGFVLAELGMIIIAMFFDKLGFMQRLREAPKEPNGP